MLGLRAITALALLMASFTPATARGSSCGASCATWVIPLIVATGAVCLFLTGVYYLAVAFVPCLRPWADARRGRARNAATGITLALAGIAALAIIVRMHVQP